VFWCDAGSQNISAKEDWPNQAIYVQDLLKALVDPTTCLSSPYAHDTIDWLNVIQTDPAVGASFIWTYTVFQVHYLCHDS
jgi:hypothetical protein